MKTRLLKILQILCLLINIVLLQPGASFTKMIRIEAHVSAYLAYNITCIPERETFDELMELQVNEISQCNIPLNNETNHNTCDHFNCTRLDNIVVFSRLGTPDENETFGCHATFLQETGLIHISAHVIYRHAEFHPYQDLQDFTSLKYSNGEDRDEQTTEKSCLTTYLIYSCIAILLICILSSIIFKRKLRHENKDKSRHGYIKAEGHEDIKAEVHKDIKEI